jgi:hypothetical protein
MYLEACSPESCVLESSFLLPGYGGVSEPFPQKFPPEKCHAFESTGVGRAGRWKRDWSYLQMERKHCSIFFF